MSPPSTTAGIYSLVQGPQLVRVFMRLLSVLMPCLLSVACPGGVYISVLFRSGRFMLCGHAQSHFRASDLS